MEPFRPEEFQPYASVLEVLAGLVKWEHVKEREGSRIGDTWAPLLEVDTLFEGDWYTNIAAMEMKKADDNLGLGQQEEPTQAVFQALLSLAMSENGEVAERVLLGDITKSLQDDLGMNSWQVGYVFRDLGFEIRTAGGNRYVYIDGKDNLIDIAELLGFEDEWLEDDVVTEEAA